MEINIKDIITLDNIDRYVVVSKITLEEETYFYLVNVNTYKNIKILKLSKDTGNLVDINKDRITNELISLFQQETRKHITEEDMKNLINFI